MEIPVRIKTGNVPAYVPGKMKGFYILKHIIFISHNPKGKQLQKGVIIL